MSDKLIVRQNNDQIEKTESDQDEIKVSKVGSMDLDPDLLKRIGPKKQKFANLLVNAPSLDMAALARAVGGVKATQLKAWSKEKDVIDYMAYLQRGIASATVEKSRDQIAILNDMVFVEMSSRFTKPDPDDLAMMSEEEAKLERARSAHFASFKDMSSFMLALNKRMQETQGTVEKTNVTEVEEIFTRAAKSQRAAKRQADAFKNVGISPDDIYQTIIMDDSGNIIPNGKVLTSPVPNNDVMQVLSPEDLESEENVSLIRRVRTTTTTKTTGSKDQREDEDE